jgi:PAS domain S-box-containing protein
MVSTPTRIYRYLIAVVIVIATLIVRLLMAPLWETTAPFALFMLATVVTAWFAGFGPAILTGICSVVIRLYFDLPHTDSWRAVSWEEAVRLSLFCGFVWGTATLLTRMRADRADLESSMQQAQHELRERQRAEAALRDSEQRLRQLADAMPQIVWTAGPAGFDYFNERWTDYTGLAIEPSRTFDGWRTVVHPDDLETAAAAWDRAAGTGETYEVEYRLKSKTGDYRWFLGRAVPVRDPSGGVARWFGTCTDIDAQKRTEQALDAARSAAEDANRVKDEFLAMVSHELRTPLNAILGWVALIRHGSVPEASMSNALEVIHRNAKTQAQLVADLLDMAGSVGGRLKVIQSEVDLVRAVRPVVERHTVTAAKNGIRLQMNGNSEPLIVWGDETRLQQVVRNLLSNALKFTPSGGRIDVRLRPMNGSVELTVSDSGSGIDPDFLPHLFERFTQAETGATRQHGGLGLGLSIARYIVELHGGSVSAHSEGQNRGACFTVLLPLHRASTERERSRKGVPPFNPAPPSVP